MRRQFVASVFSVLAGSLLLGPVAAQSKAPPFQPVPVQSAPATLFTIPFVELIYEPNFNFVTAPLLHMVYTAGLVDGREPVGATVNVSLFDRVTGLPMQSKTGSDICNPCSIALGTSANPGSAPRQVQFNIQVAVDLAGGIDKTLRGFVQYQISGDAANVAVQTVGSISGTERLLLQAYAVR